MGWAVSVAATAFFVLLLGLRDGAMHRPFAGVSGLLVTLAILSAPLSGFLSYLAGGFAAARLARGSGGRHGAMTAVFGLLVGVVAGLVLVVLGTIPFPAFSDPSPGYRTSLPILGQLVGVKLVVLQLPVAAILFPINLLGGYLGGRMG